MGLGFSGFTFRSRKETDGRRQAPCGLRAVRFGDGELGFPIRDAGLVEFIENVLRGSRLNFF